MNKFRKNSLLVLLALAFAMTSACGADDPSPSTNNKNNNNGADVQEDVGVTDTDETDKDIDETVPDVEETDKDIDETDKDIDETDPDVEETDVPPGDNGNSPIAEDSAVIEALLDDPEADAEFAGVLVTYIKAETGNDPAGFFIQAEKEGPAAFVEVDPTTLEPPVVVGNVIKFKVVSVKTEDNYGRLEIDEISDLEVLGVFDDVPSFVQNVNDVDDLVTNLDDYSLELIAGTFTVNGPAGFGGVGFSSYPVSTDALAEGVVLRMPESLAAPLVLIDGCVVTLAGTPLWRHNDTPQASALTIEDFELSECPLQAMTAKATSETTVEITFSRDIDEATLEADGSQFANSSADEDFQVTAASVDGNVITLTTSAQNAGENYILTIATTLEDVLGLELEGGTAVAFNGFDDSIVGPGAANDVVISEFMPRSKSGAPDPGEYIELYNPSDDQTLNLDECVIIVGDKETVLSADMAIGPKQYLVFSNGNDELGTRAIDGLLVAGTNLGNKGGTLTLTCKNIEIDTLTYTGGNVKLGQAFQKSVDKLTDDNDPIATNWCVVPNDDDTYKYHDAADGDNDKFGTPGEANFVCP